MKSRCVLLRGDGGLVHNEVDRESTAASLAGRDGPEAGAFCSKPSLATVYICTFAQAVPPGMLSSYSSLF